MATRTKAPGSSVLSALLLGFASLAIACAATYSASPSPTLLPTTPELTDLPPGKVGAIIRYGFELLANTPKYLGPQGEVGRYAKNRLACRNCHLDVGMRPFGNSHSS